MHRCQCFTQSLKAPWKSTPTISFSVVVVASLTACTAPCWVPFKVLLILEDKKKSGGAISGLCGNWAELPHQIWPETQKWWARCRLAPCYGATSIQYCTFLLGYVGPSCPTVSQLNSLLTICPCSTNSLCTTTLQWQLNKRCSFMVRILVPFSSRLISFRDYH